MLVTTRCGEPEAPKKAPPSLDNRAESPPLLVLAESSGVATVSCYVIARLKHFSSCATILVHHSLPGLNNGEWTGASTN